MHQYRRCSQACRCQRDCCGTTWTDDDNDDDANDGDFDDTLGELLGDSFRVTPSLDLDLAFGAVNSNTDLACTHLLSPPSPLPPPLSSAPSSAAAGEPF